MVTLVDRKSILSFSLCFVLSCIGLWSCKPRTLNSKVSETTLEQKVPFPTTVYHWTTDSRVLRPDDYIFKELAGADEKNKNTSKISGHAVLGHGLYTSVEPLASSKYGNFLLELTVSPGEEYRYTLPRNLEAVKSAASMLLYDFEPGPLSAQERLALVIRRPKFIDFKSLRVYDGSRPRPIASHKPLTAASLQALLTEYADQPALLWSVLKEDRNLDEALAYAALSEIESGVPEVAQRLSAIDPSKLRFELDCAGISNSLIPRFGNSVIGSCRGRAFDIANSGYELEEFLSPLIFFKYVPKTTERNSAAVIAAAAGEMRKEPLNVVRIEELLKVIPDIRKQFTSSNTLAKWKRN